MRDKASGDQRVYPNAVQDLDDLLDPAEAASKLRVKPHTLAIWRSTRRYALPYVRVGRLVRYRRTDIEAFIAKGTIDMETGHE